MCTILILADAFTLYTNTSVLQRKPPSGSNKSQVYRGNNALVHDFHSCTCHGEIAASKLHQTAFATLYQLHGYGMGIHGIG